LKARAIHPPLVALLPLLAVYSSNQRMVLLEDLWRPAVVAVVAALLLWGLLRLFLRDQERSAVAASCLIVTFFGYSIVEGALGFYGRWAPWVWLPLSLILTVVLVSKLKATKALNFFAVTATLVALAQIGWGHYSLSRQHVLVLEQAGTRAARPDSPDVFYFVLDGYGRSDALQASVGYDNSSFIRELRERGFYVADRAVANYVQTELSLAATLNLDWIQNLLPQAGPGTDRQVLERLVNNPSVLRDFASRGYETIAVTSRFPTVTFDGAERDLIYEPAGGLSLLEATWLGLTPLKLESRTMGSMYRQRWHTLSKVFDQLEGLAQRRSRPRFVLAHILAPHPPFVFDEEGNFVRQPGPFGFWDGSDYLAHIGNAEDYRQRYAKQATYLNKRLLRIVDKLVAASGDKPVIVLQGDHGAKSGLDQNSLENTDLTECFPVLSAFLVPSGIREKFYPEISNVNTFRVLIEGLFDEPQPLQDDRSWYSTYPEPFVFTEVTEALR